MAVNNSGILTLSGAIQHRRGTSSALEASGYVPASGEIIIATDTGELRSGDGIHTWNDLPSLYSRLHALEDVHEAVLSVRLTAQQVQQMYFELPATCVNDRIIRLYLCGMITERGIDWEVSVNEDLGGAVISWKGRGLEALVREGDKILVDYYERM